MRYEIDIVMSINEGMDIAVGYNRMCGHFISMNTPLTYEIHIVMSINEVMGIDAGYNRKCGHFISMNTPLTYENEKHIVMSINYSSLRWTCIKACTYMIETHTDRI